MEGLQIKENFNFQNIILICSLETNIPEIGDIREKFEDRIIIQSSNYQVKLQKSSQKNNVDHLFLSISKFTENNSLYDKTDQYLLEFLQVNASLIIINEEEKIYEQFHQLRNITYKAYLAQLIFNEEEINQFNGLILRRIFNYTQLLQYIEFKTNNFNSTLNDFIRDLLQQNIKETYQLTIYNNLLTCHIAPILISPINVLKSIIDYQLGKLFLNQKEYLEESQYFLSNCDYIKTQIEEINEVNLYSLLIITRSLDILDFFYKMKWKVSKNLIQLKQKLDNFIKKDLAAKGHQFPNWANKRIVELTDLLISYSEKLLNNLYELLDVLLQQLFEEYFHPEKIKEELQEIIENQMNSLVYDLYDFANLELDPSIPIQKSIVEIFLKIENQYIGISKDFFHYLLFVSFYCNCRMQELNSLLDEYQSLANIDTYKILQVEVSRHLLIKTEDYLLSRQFLRPEFYQYTHQIVRQTIRHFYYICENIKDTLDYKEISKSFNQQLKKMNADINSNVQQNVQIIEKNVFLEFIPNQQCWVQMLSIQDILENNYQKLNCLKDFNEILIIKCQEIILKNKTKFAIIALAVMNNNSQTIIIEINSENKYSIIQTSINPNIWTAYSEIHLDNPLSLIDFLFNSQDALNNSKIGSQQILVFFEKKNIEVSEEELIQKQQQFKNPSLKLKSVRVPRRPIRYGTSANLVAGKALGAGIGCLIVDCMDDDITWEDKFKNAGFLVMTLGVLGLIASRLPMVGLLIQEIILAYAIKITLDNKVINVNERMKNLGHLGIQIGLGVGFTIAGGMLIPIPFWGSVIGGICGGVAMGVYAKCIVPMAMENLFDMLEQIERFITAEGYIKFDPLVIEFLRFDPENYEKMRPQDIAKNDWFTIQIICLVNEMSYVFQAYCKKEYVKLQKKIDKDANNLKAREKYKQLRKYQIDGEVKLTIWNDSRNYVKQKKLQVYNHHKTINKFIDGMLANFKVFG